MEFRTDKHAQKPRKPRAHQTERAHPPRNARLANDRKRQRGAAAARSPRRGPMAAVALVMLAGFAIVGLLAGLGRCSSTMGETASPAYVSPYDWSGLSRNGDRLAYAEGNAVRSQVGVDVSDHQGAIDWHAVAADGIEFAFVRAGNRGYTEGGLFADARFAENVDGAQAAGLDTGAYFFSQAVTVQEAQEEADLVLSLLAGRALELPVAFDHEPVSDQAGRANNLDQETLTACARAFCERIEAAGYATMVYGNKGDMARYNSAALGNRRVWFAEYDAAVPSAQFDFAVWQYTNGGTVAGITTPVDLNLRFTEYL